MTISHTASQNRGQVELDVGVGMRALGGSGDLRQGTPGVSCFDRPVQRMDTKTMVLRDAGTPAPRSTRRFKV